MPIDDGIEFERDCARAVSGLQKEPKVSLDHLRGGWDDLIEAVVVERVCDKCTPVPKVGLASSTSLDRWENLGVKEGGVVFN